MTDPPLQSFSRYIAIDIHKHYLMLGGIDAHKRLVLTPRRVELSRWPAWAGWCRARPTAASAGARAIRLWPARPA